MQTQFYKDHMTQIKTDPNIGYKPNFLGLTLESHRTCMLLSRNEKGKMKKAKIEVNDDHAKRNKHSCTTAQQPTLTHFRQAVGTNKLMLCMVSEHLKKKFF